MASFEYGVIFGENLNMGLIRGLNSDLRGMSRNL